MRRIQILPKSPTLLLLVIRGVELRGASTIDTLTLAAVERDPEVTVRSGSADPVRHNWLIRSAVITSIAS